MRPRRTSHGVVLCALLASLTSPRLASASVVVAPAAIALTAAHAGGADSEEIEELEEVEVLPGASATSLSPIEIIGRLHPAFVHLPIAWALLLLLLELWAQAGRRMPQPDPAVALGVLLLLSLLAAGVTGLLVADAPPYSVDAEALARAHEHRNIMLGAAAALSAAVLLRGLGLGAPRASLRLPYLGVLLLGVCLIAYGGHRGGLLVHGDAYLPF